MAMSETLLKEQSRDCTLKKQKTIETSSYMVEFIVYDTFQTTGRKP